MRQTLQRLLIPALAAWAVGTALAAPPAALDALVSYETRQVMPNGVTRIDSWQERLVRRGDQVWTERVLPAHRYEERPQAEHMGHKHFNGDTSARWLSRGANGGLEVKLVDRTHRVIVSVPRAEFGAVGFDGSFEAAASIVPEAVVKAMKAAPGQRAATGAPNNETWRTDRSQGWTHRVLWSESRRLAMKVESKRDDGTVRRIVTVQLRSAGRVLPWQQLANYSDKRYDDFMD